MLIPALLSTSMLLVPVKDTVWWNSTAGRVVEHRDETAADCTLTFQSGDGSVVFEWKGTGGTTVTVFNANWSFPDDNALPVAMQLGDTWLSNGANSAILDAVGHGNAVTFLVNQPVEPLLRPADHIEIRVKAGTLSLPLEHWKVGVLLDRVQMCRDVIKR